MGRNPEQDILHSNTGKLDKGFEYHQVKDYNFNWVIPIYMWDGVTKEKKSSSQYIHIILYVWYKII